MLAIQKIIHKQIYIMELKPKEKETRNRKRVIPEEWKMRKIRLSDGAYGKLQAISKEKGMPPSLFLEKLINQNL